MTMLKRGGLLVLGVIAVFGWQAYSKSQASADVRAQSVKLLESFPLYAQHKDFYQSAFDQAHQTAFDQSYRHGGRRRSASFDEGKYVSLLVDSIKRQATAAGNESVAYALNGYGQYLSLPVANSNNAEPSRY